MRLLVLAALAAVALADVSHLAGYQYNVPASSYGVPQNSVTERQFNVVPTSPSPGLHLPAFEHQDFNALGQFPGVVVSSTPAPFVDTSFVSSTPAPTVDSSLILSSTPAPSVVGGGLDFNAQLPGLNSGFSYTTPAPSLSFNSGGLGSVAQLGGLGSSFVSSTAAPHVQVTSGSQESLNAEVQFPSFGFNSGLSAYTTPAPLFSSTVAPTISTGFGLGSGLGLGSAYNFPGFGLDAFSTVSPLGFGPGPAYNVQGLTSGGSISDAFGISSATVQAGILPQPQQVSKHLYFYAAPEEPVVRPRINIAPVAPPKKNVKVIFIKAPTPPAPPQINIAAPPQDEQKTVVYVLVKKPEDTQNIEIQTPPPTPAARPEVYFIKYKTQQEAEEAIAKVQNNQDDGATATINGGGIVSTTAPSLPIFNYISSTTTPAPLFNFVGGGFPGPIASGGFAGPIVDGGFSFPSTTPAPLLNFVGGGISGPIQTGGEFTVSSTTPAPLLNFVGGISGPIANSGIGLDDTDISQNLISSGGQTSSLFSTGSPLLNSLAPVGSSFVGTTTVAPPQVPHSTYGPPILKKK